MKNVFNTTGRNGLWYYIKSDMAGEKGTQRRCYGTNNNNECAVFQSLTIDIFKIFLLLLIFFCLWSMVANSGIFDTPTFLTFLWIWKKIQWLMWRWSNFTKYAWPFSQFYLNCFKWRKVLRTCLNMDDQTHELFTHNNEKKIENSYRLLVAPRVVTHSYQSIIPLFEDS